MKKKTPLQVHLDADQLKWLRRIAKHQRCSMSQVIRMLICRARLPEPVIMPGQSVTGDLGVATMSQWKADLEVAK